MLMHLDSGYRNRRILAQPNLSSLFTNSAGRHEAGMVIHASAL